jgi:DNA-binding transcriptional LysR family regulator
VTDAVQQLSERRPELSIEVFRTDWYDQTEVILDGRVDVGYLRRPFDPKCLGIEPLLEEPRVVSLPVDHRLAGKATVSVTDLADEHLLQDPEVVPGVARHRHRTASARAARGHAATAHGGGEA